MQIAKTEGSESETPRNLITKPYYLRGSSATNGRYKQNIGNGMTKNNNNPIIISKQEQIKPPNNNSGKNYMTISNANRTYSHFLPKIKLEEVNANTSIVTKQNKFSIEDGITYKTSNGLKMYFYIPTVDVFLLKEIKFTNSNGLIQKINEWNNSINSTNDNYIKIYQTLVNVPEGYITIVLEQPLGATLRNIISSVGLMGEGFIMTIARNLLPGINTNNFCICDIYFDFFEKIKLLPHFLTSCSNCECSVYMTQLSKLYNISIEPIFSLGFLLLKLIIGNFPIKSFDILISSKRHIKCCLLHTILDIENSNSIDTLRLSDLLSLYSQSFKDFLCECLSFTHRDVDSIISHKWFFSNSNQDKVKITMRELLKIVKITNDDVNQNISSFIDTFEIVYHNMKLGDSLYKDYFKKITERSNIVHFLSLCFEIEDEELLEKIYLKIKGKQKTNNNKININDKNTKDICLNGNDNVYINNKY